MKSSGSNMTFPSATINLMKILRFLRVSGSILRIFLAKSAVVISAKYVVTNKMSIKIIKKFDRIKIMGVI